MREKLTGLAGVFSRVARRFLWEVGEVAMRRTMA